MGRLPIKRLSSPIPVAPPPYNGGMYQQRINLVLDHIRTYPAADLSVNELARVAAFSPYHFHRIFTGMVGETVAQYVLRVRLERAVALLKGDPGLPIIAAAVESGFQSPSAFSRAFRQRYGIAPRRWNRATTLTASDDPAIRTNDSKNRQLFETIPRYTEQEFAEMAGEFTVTLETVPAQPMAVLRVTNSYQNGAVTGAYDRLLAWARTQGIDPLACTLLGMSQDDPYVTPLDLCRYDICLVVNKATYTRLVPKDEIHLRIFPASMWAVLHAQGDIVVVDRAWQYLYRYWLPHSQYEPDNLPAIERFRRQPAEIGWDWYEVDGCIPILL